MTLQKKEVLIISSDKEIQEQLIATIRTLNCSRYTTVVDPDDALKEINRNKFDLILCELEFDDSKNDIFDVFTALMKKEQSPSVVIYSDEVEHYREDILGLLNHFTVKYLKTPSTNNSKIIYFIASAIKEVLEIAECKVLKTDTVPELQKKVSELESSLSSNNNELKTELVEFMTDFLKTNRESLIKTSMKVVAGLTTLAGVVYGLAVNYITSLPK